MIGNALHIKKLQVWEDESLPFYDRTAAKTGDFNENEQLLLIYLRIKSIDGYMKGLMSIWFIPLLF